jgi:hypothetical protein
VSEVSEVGLYQKIRQVMKDVSYLSKDDNIAFGNTKYKAISEEKVTSTLRESLINNGLVILPFEQTASKNGNISSVNTKYKIVDIDTGQYEVLASSGEGADTQDKGVGKAMTYAYKYMLLRTFAIPTGEDPDKVSSVELDEKQKVQEKKQKDNDDLAQIERNSKLNNVLIKWQTLTGEKDSKKAKQDFAEFLDKQQYSIESVPTKVLESLETKFTKKLLDKAKSEKESA